MKRIALIHPKEKIPMGKDIMQKLTWQFYFRVQFRLPPGNSAITSQMPTPQVTPVTQLLQYPKQTALQRKKEPVSMEENQISWHHGINELEFEIPKEGIVHAK